MKILITGRPGSGKSIFAKYLKDQHPDFTIIEFDDFYPDIKAFESKAQSADDCIVVIQHQKFIKSPIKFDKSYQCTRVETEAFQVNDGTEIQNFAFLDLEQYFDPSLNGAFSN